MASQQAQEADALPFDIVGGELSETPFPYFAQLENSCSASLIHDDMLLTAAYFREASSTIKDLPVYLGGLQSFNASVIRTAIEFFVHPLYQRHEPYFNDYDFMLVKIDSSALVEGTQIDSETQSEIPLPTQLAPIPLNPNETNPAPNDPLLVMVFGQTSEGGRRSEFLRQVTVLAEDRNC
jgi:hypothetical protein